MEHLEDRWYIEGAMNHEPASMSPELGDFSLSAARAVDDSSNMAVPHFLKDFSDERKVCSRRRQKGSCYGEARVLRQLIGQFIFSSVYETAAHLRSERLGELPIGRTETVVSRVGKTVVSDTRVLAPWVFPHGLPR